MMNTSTTTTSFGRPLRNHLLKAVGAALALALASQTIGCAASQKDDTSAGRSKITKNLLNLDNETSSEHPAVGMLYTAVSATQGGVCTGTLIGKRTVLTAAHCASEDLNKISFHVESEDGQVTDAVKIAKIVVHPSYDAEAQKETAKALEMHDIAIVTLTRELPWIEPIRVATNSVSKAPTTLIGYGFTAKAERDGGKKHSSLNFLQEEYPNYIAFVPKFVSGQVTPVFGISCNGDSGGPALVDNAILGVVSFGDSECEKFAAYTRTDKVLPWIREASGGDALFSDE
jgi:secreted trypsin-like serine protease